MGGVSERLRGALLLAGPKPRQHVCGKLWETSGEGEEDMKSGELKAIFHLPALTQVLLSLASQAS